MKFLRRTRHFASIVTLFVGLSAACALTQSKPDEPTDADRQSSQEQTDAKILATLDQIATNTAENAAPNQARNQPPDPYAGWIAASAVTQGLAAIAIVGFTLWLVVLNRGLLNETKKAADAANTSADVASQALARTNRPLIRIRGVGVSSTGAGDRPVARVQLANIGGSDAQKIEYNIGWFVWKTLPSENPAAAPLISSLLADHHATPNAQRPLELAKIQPGHWRFIQTVKMDLGKVPGLDERYRWEEGGDDYIAGRVRYHDSANRPRVTAYCRRLNKVTGRFEPVDDPDYEYEE